MQGGIQTFLKLVSETPELARDLRELARRYGFEFTDELSDDDLDAISGGATVKVIMSSLTGGGLPDGMSGPPAGSPVPTPYPNVSGAEGGGNVKVDPSGTGVSSSGTVTTSSGDEPG